MRYINRVRGTTKGGCDALLAPKTLIVGANGVGKTRLINTIELALTGEASNVSGKAMASAGTELITLAPHNQNLEAYVQFNDGEEGNFALTRSTPKGGKGAEKKAAASTSKTWEPPKSIDPEMVMPLGLLRGAMTSPEAARKFFLKHAVGDVAESDILGRLAPELHELYRAAVADCTMRDTQIDRLLHALAGATKRAREYSQSAEMTLANANNASFGGGVLPTEALIASARRQVTDCRQALERAVLASQSIGTADAAKAGVNDAKVRLMRAEDRLVTQKARLEDVNKRRAALPPVTELEPGMMQTIQAIRWHQQKNLSKCVCCGFDVCSGRDDGSTVFETPAAHWAARKEIADTKHATTTGLMVRHQRAGEVLANVQLEVQAAAQEVSAAQRELARWEEMVAKSVTVAPEEAAHIGSIEQLRSMTDDADLKLQQMLSAQAAWESASSLRSSSLEAKNKANKWEQLSEACKSVVKLLLDAGVAEFEAKVRHYLPTKHKFALQLHDSLGRETCRYGLMRKGEIQTALSEGEWAQVVCAIAAVISSQPDEKGNVPFSVIVPPDRAFDPKTLTQVLKAFSDMPQQVIITSTVMPAQVPAGWRVVNLNVDAKTEEGEEVADVETGVTPPPAEQVAAPTPTTPVELN